MNNNKLDRTMLQAHARAKHLSKFPNTGAKVIWQRVCTEEQDVSIIECEFWPMTTDIIYHNGGPASMLHASKLQPNIAKTPIGSCRMELDVWRLHNPSIERRYPMIQHLILIHPLDVLRTDSDPAIASGVAETGDLAELLCEFEVAALEITDSFCQYLSALTKVLK